MRKNQLFALVFGVLFALSPQAAHADGVIRIDGGANGTSDREVLLEINAPDNAVEMRISNNANYSDTRWESVKRNKTWTLDYGGGTKRVVIQFRDRNGNVHNGTFEDDIYLAVPPRMTVDFDINDDDSHTGSRHVTLDIVYSDGVEAMAISNSDDFGNVQYNTIQERVQWVLSSGTGGKTIFIRFRDANNQYKTIEKHIFYEQPDNYIPEGSLLKGRADTVYYYGYDGKLHPFFHNLAYQSYYTSFNGIKFVSQEKLNTYPLAEPVCVRQGTWLLKFKNSARVYAVEPGCELRPIRSEAEAYLLYGPHWAKRIVELHAANASFYNVRELTNEDRDEDRDRDGIPSEIEAEYGTSDFSRDFDNDALSDYEEINFWYTDPTNPDSDGDGMMDGREITQGRNPAGTGALEEVPENTYRFPRGSVVFKWWDDDDYYYFHHDRHVYYLSNRVTDDSFTTNNFQSRFVLSPPYEIDFEHRAGWFIYEEHDYMKQPLTTRYNNVTLL